MKIYTKTGDKGETGIIGSRVLKNSAVIHSIGNIDELNSLLGLILSKASQENKHAESSKTWVNTINKIQNALFDLGAILAKGKSDQDFVNLTLILEKEIDLMQKDLKPLLNFILPGGSEISSYIHLARSTCRRAERFLVETITEQSNRKSEDREQLFEALSFINRLSDYLFVLARYINNELGYEDIIWGKNRSNKQNAQN